MPRIRTVKPDFWEDDVIGCLSRDERLLFIATWNLADDEGRLRWSAPYLKASAFIFDDDISVGDVEAMMTSLVDAGLISTYRAGKANQALGLVVNFKKHQNVNRPLPSKLPPPPNGLTERLTESLNEPAVSDSLAERERERERERDKKERLPNGSPSESPVAIADPRPPPKARIAREMAEVWNRVCGDVLPQARGSPGKTRQQHLLARFSGELERDMARWELVCRRVRASRFLTGQAAARNGTQPFTASLDWVAAPSNFAKVVEGNYDDRKPAGRMGIDEWASRLAREHGERHGGH